MTTRKDDDWTTLTYAMNKLACSHRAIIIMIKHGQLSCLNVPHAYPKLSRREVDALAEKSFTPAKVGGRAS